MASEFSARLQTLRKRKGLSCKALGECCRLSKNTIRLYERGKREPTIKTLIQIADYFEVSTDYLLGRKKFF